MLYAPGLIKSDKISSLYSFSFPPESILQDNQFLSKRICNVGWSEVYPGGTLSYTATLATSTMLLQSCKCYNSTILADLGCTAYTLLYCTDGYQRLSYNQIISYNQKHNLLEGSTLTGSRVLRNVKCDRVKKCKTWRAEEWKWECGLCCSCGQDRWFHCPPPRNPRQRGHNRGFRSPQNAKSEIQNSVWT